MAITYEPIATTTLGTAANTITFSSIPATYTDLKVILTGFIEYTSPDRSYLYMRFNGDTGANYSATFIKGDGTTASSSSDTSLTSARIGYISWSVAGSGAYYSLNEIDVFSYAGSTYKTALGRGNVDMNTAATGEVHRNVILWRSTSAITSVALYSSLTRDFGVGTTATLYGIKAA
jgi:hypothetical protein